MTNSIHKIDFYIIVPAYNAQDTIIDAISSALNQSESNLYNTKIVIVDDGSIDNTLICCKEKFFKNNNVVILNKKHSGVVDTRKMGIDWIYNTITEKPDSSNYSSRNIDTSTRNCSYILFLDSDDKLDSKCLENYCHMIINNNYPELIISNYYKWTATDKYTISKFPFKVGLYNDKTKTEEFYPWIYQMYHPIPAWSTATKVDIVYNNYPDCSGLIIGEDRLLTSKLIWASSTILFDDNPTYCYNLFNDKSATRTNSLDPKQLVLFHKSYSKCFDSADTIIQNQCFNFVFYNLMRHMYFYSKNSECPYCLLSSDKTKYGSPKDIKILAQNYLTEYQSQLEYFSAHLQINPLLPKIKRVFSGRIIAKIKSKKIYDIMKILNYMVKLKIINFDF